MKTITPKSLKQGDLIQIVAPSLSASIFNEETMNVAKDRLENVGFRVRLSKRIYKKDIFRSTPVEDRAADLMEAFADPEVSAIMPVVGGFNSNQLLPLLDYSVIKENPKILIGYSDITALNNAIYAKTGLQTYQGPSFFSFAMKKGFEYSQNGFLQCLTNNNSYQIEPAEAWSDDNWCKDQDNRTFISGSDPYVLNSGIAEGTIIGGNLCTLNLLQGTTYMPDVRGKILFLEDDDIITGKDFPPEFFRNLTSLFQIEGAEDIRGIVMGRFQRSTTMDREKLEEIVMQTPLLQKIPVVANVEFGHTIPRATFPVGAKARIDATNEVPTITIR